MPELPSDSRRCASWLVGGHCVMIVVLLLVGVRMIDLTGEGGVLTWVSGLQLLAGAVLCWRVGRAGAGTGARPFIWALLAAGFLFLALDDVARLHEAADDFIHTAFGLHKTKWTDRIDDAIVAVYGLVGLALLYWRRADFRRFRSVAPLVVAGFALFSVMAVVDALTSRGNLLRLMTADRAAFEGLKSWLGLAEESLKVVSEAMFLGALAGCRQIARETPGLNDDPAYASTTAEPFSAQKQHATPNRARASGPPRR